MTRTGVNFGQRGDSLAGQGGASGRELWQIWQANRLDLHAEQALC
ncbi:MAG: hypothetical protein ABIQ18_44835 [Umezawaea sp.]